MDTYEWLGMWENIEAPGKHSRMVPAVNAHGYSRGYSAADIDKTPRMPEQIPTYRDRVIRAIPADGVVEDTPPSWMRSPQVRMWMETQKTAKAVNRWRRRLARCLYWCWR